MDVSIMIFFLLLVRAIERQLLCVGKMIFLAILGERCSSIQLSYSLTELLNTQNLVKQCTFS